MAYWGSLGASGAYEGLWGWRGLLYRGLRAPLGPRAGVIDSRAVSRMNMEFYIKIALWPLLLKVPIT